MSKTGPTEAYGGVRGRMTRARQHVNEYNRDMAAGLWCVSFQILLVSRVGQLWQGRLRHAYSAFSLNIT